MAVGTFGLVFCINCVETVAFVRIIITKVSKLGYFLLFLTGFESVCFLRLSIDFECNW